MRDQTEVSTPDRILRLPEVVRRCGLSKPTIYRRMREGQFPPRLDLGGRAVGWRAREVEAWCERLAEPTR